TLANQTNQAEFTNETYTKIEVSIQLLSFLRWSLLKLIVFEFIQMKCMILDDDLNVVWDEIADSLSCQHID
ncbi:unnamed protein product, partial [Adineta steineri]